MQQFYQDANSDPPVDIEFAAIVDMPQFKCKIKPKIHSTTDGWTVTDVKQHKEVSEIL